MKNPFGLYLVITNPVGGYERCTDAAVRAELRMIQLRMKNEPREHIVSTARKLRAITAGTRTLFIVNDDPAIAEEVGADGVHLGQSDMPLPVARERFPSLKFFGLSTHSPEQVAAAMALTPDYIGVGPVYTTPTKAIPDAVLGLATMRKMLAAASCPTVAIGGIDAMRLPEVLRAGAQNFSVVRAVCGSCDPYAAICRLQNIWRNSINPDEESILKASTKILISKTEGESVL